MRAAFLAEQLDDEVREAVDDSRLLVEVGCAVDHAEHLDPLDDELEVADLALERRHEVDAGQPRGLVPLLHGQVRSELAAMDDLATKDRAHAGEVDEVPDASSGHEVDRDAARQADR